MAVGAAIGSAIGTAASGIFGTLYQANEARRNARAQRGWQHEMSQTAHQRQVEDLRAAGLNPILAAGGSGAQVGTGATASVPEYGSTALHAISTATQLAKTRAETRQVRARAGLDKVDLEFQNQMLKHMRNNPQLRDVLMNSMLAKKVGIRPELGASLFNISTAATRGDSAFNRLLEWIGKRYMQVQSRKPRPRKDAPKLLTETQLRQLERNSRRRPK